MAFHVPAFDAAGVPGRALDVLAQAYFAPTSPLHKDLVLDRQWVEWITAGAEDHRDPGFFLVLAKIKDTERVGDVREAIERTLEQAASTALPAERLVEVTSRLRYGFLSGVVAPDQVAATVCHYAQLTGGTTAIDASFATLDRVGASDVAGAAERFFRPSNRTAVTLIPGASGDPA
jgi:zinc protease